MTPSPEIENIIERAIESASSRNHEYVTIEHLLLSLITSLLVLLISLNQQKKYLSKAIIVIEPEDNNIVNIEEAYSVESRANRINNQMAILKSDEVLEYIIKDKKNSILFFFLLFFD